MINDNEIILDDYEQSIEDMVETLVPVSPETKAQFDAIIDSRESEPIQVNLANDVSSWVKKLGNNYSLIVNELLREVIKLQKIGTQRGGRVV
jgi:uncharacterized protein (DUF4415 family)